MSTAAESIRRYMPFFKKQNVSTVLDHGAGNLRNALFLADQGFKVFAADLPVQLEKLQGCPGLRHIERLLAVEELSYSRLNVDLVLSTYVYNIIMGRADRDSYICSAVANLKPGGHLLMEVRCRQNNGRCGTSCSDYLACAECSKTLTHQELDFLLNPHGLRRICHYYRQHAVAAIYRMDRR